MAAARLPWPLLLPRQTPLSRRQASAPSPRRPLTCFPSVASLLRVLHRHGPEPRLSPLPGLRLPAYPSCSRCQARFLLMGRTLLWVQTACLPPVDVWAVSPSWVLGWSCCEPGRASFSQVAGGCPSAASVGGRPPVGDAGVRAQKEARLPAQVGQTISPGALLSHPCLRRRERSGRRTCAFGSAAPYPWPSSRCLSQPRGPGNTFLLTVGSAALRPAENKAKCGQFPLLGRMLHRPDHSAGNAQTCVKAACFRKQHVSPVRPAGLRVTSAGPGSVMLGPSLHLSDLWP